MPVDPILFEVIRSRLDGIVREMQIDTFRTGYSTLIRETHDLSCGLVDREGRVVAQFAGIPIHMGSYPDCIQGLLKYYSYDEIEDGDCFFVNHPYESGCAHSLDSAAIVPIHYQGDLVAFGIGITHKGDIGGLSPGSRAANARDLFGEGMQVPPVKYMSRHKVIKETENLIWANSRTPELLLGDYNAQAGPMWSVGARRVTEIMDKHGKDAVLEVFEEVGRQTERHLRAEISKWEDGIYEEVTTRAVKRVLARQLEAAMKEKALTKTKMAKQMKTSRVALNRLLDPENEAVTLDTLQRAAAVVGREVRLELV